MSVHSSLNLSCHSRKIFKNYKKDKQTYFSPKLSKSKIDENLSPFLSCFDKFTIYPDIIKSHLLEIKHLPSLSEIEKISLNLDAKETFSSSQYDNILFLANDQQKKINTALGILNFTKTANLSQKAINQPFKSNEQLHFEKTDFKIQNLVINGSFENLKAKTYISKEDFQMDSASTITTTPSKRNSPLFNEKKSLLLSSKVENILNDEDEMYVKKFNHHEEFISDLQKEEEENDNSFLQKYTRDDIDIEKEENNLTNARRNDFDNFFFGNENNFSFL